MPSPHFEGSRTSWSFARSNNVDLFAYSIVEKIWFNVTAGDFFACFDEQEIYCALLLADLEEISIWNL